MSENAVSHLIEIRDLKKTYTSGTSEVTALDGMGFAIDDGEFITIMGQSGSGKSTLLSILGAMNRPSNGQVLVDSLDLYALTREQRADFRSEYMGFIFQSFQLIPYLTVLENVTLPMAITGRKKKVKKAMAMAVIERVGLGEKAGRLPDQLSGGAGTGGHCPGHREPPPIILADEPTGNLDSSTAREIMALLRGLNREGHTIIMVTHNPEMEAYAHRSIRVQDGRVVPAA